MIANLVNYSFPAVIKGDSTQRCHVVAMVLDLVDRGKGTSWINVSRFDEQFKYLAEIKETVLVHEAMITCYNGDKRHLIFASQNTNKVFFLDKASAMLFKLKFGGTISFDGEMLVRKDY